MIPLFITVHCSATKTGVYFTAQQIKKMHTDPKPVGKGWRDIGYHYVIRTDGVVEKGREDNVQGAHVSGFNENNLGVCLVGGVGSNGKPLNNYTEPQLHALYALIIELCGKYKIPFSNVFGHRDWFGDSNGDGVVDSRDWYKDCPCFDVKGWLLAQLKENGEAGGKLL